MSKSKSKFWPIFFKVALIATPVIVFAAITTLAATMAYSTRGDYGLHLVLGTAALCTGIIAAGSWAIRWTNRVPWA